MTGFKISSEELSEITEILGLTEDQSKTYIALLSLGMATLGQISILSGLDYITTQETLQMLVGSKLALRIPGKVGRYIALEPYLKSFSLAYDPITLINIRKESSNMIKSQREGISEILANSTKEFQEKCLLLDKNFTQNFEPVKANFNDISKNLNNLIDKYENEVQNNIKKLQQVINEISNEMIDLNDKILALNLRNISIIPTIYTSSLPNLKTDLDTLFQESISPLEHFQSHFHNELENFKKSVIENFSNQKLLFDQIIGQFESNQIKNREFIENGINNLYQELDLARKNAERSNSTFVEVRNNFQDISSSIDEFTSETRALLTSNEPVLNEIIEDIQSRKLFKGKDEVINNLLKIRDTHTKINEVLAQQHTITDKINTSNAFFQSSEDEIINASLTGISTFSSLLNTLGLNVKEDLETIESKILSAFKNMVHKNSEEHEQAVLSSFTDLNDNLTSLANQFQQEIKNINNHYHESVSTFIKDSVITFEDSLKSFFEKEKGKTLKSSGFDEILTKTSEIGPKISSETKELSSEVTTFENSVTTYFDSITGVTTNFSNIQLNSFISALKTVNSDLNQQVNTIETQIDQEISALTFSIKQMRQKLEKIFTLSRNITMSEAEATLYNSDIVVGEPSIIMLLRDLTLRSKSSLTILMPRPELQTLNVASKLPMRTRVTIIGDFRKVPEATLQRILQAGNLRLKQLDGIDFWGCIRDAEELLVCPEPKDPTKDPLLGVITTNQNLVDLFSKELMTYTTRSREIVI